MSTTETLEISTQTFVDSSKIEWQQMAEGVSRKILSYDKNLMMVRVSFETGGIGTLHQHPHIQMSLIESGSFEVQIDGVKKVLHAGDVFYVHSNLIHGVVCLDKGVLVDVFNPMREDFIQ
jgi:quercetin dioxygenase-like cupin family protein